MRFLVAAGSVHATAAACDYLEGRDGDVRVVAAGDRDAADALNVAAVRLPGADADRRDGTLVEAVLDAVGEGDVDEVVVGASDHAPELVERSPVPVVVVPDGE